jgi:Zn/Cd-binding protein ZinT
MKTAMQEWFDELKSNYPYMANEIFDKGFNKYLEKEKEQIIKAHTNAYLIGEDDISVEDANEASMKYYKQTYNTKQHIIDIMKADEDDGLYNQNK